MSSTAATMPATAAAADRTHPKGLYVLFATEMWERFSFYSMLAMFTLYLRDPREGFGWTAAEATSLYANYLMFVYASPLVGGWIADKKLGYRKAVMLGGVFFIAGHLLLSFRSLPVVYLALVCLVVGNGFFKPNVSTMVGNLYPEGSPLKDRAYNIFYMGINVGSGLAPIVMELVRSRFGFHPAFAVAAAGMAISVWILWQFQKHVGDARDAHGVAPVREADAAATAVDAPPSAASRQQLMEAVPERTRILALIVVFAIVIVFWMVFHQNGSTLTYWADDNTDWNVSGIISNAINPIFVVTLTFPLIFFWKFLSDRGMEPSTPTKMAIGMTLTGLSFILLCLGARGGEAASVDTASYPTASFRVTQRAADNLAAQGVPAAVVDKLKADENKILSTKFSEQKLAALKEENTPEPVLAALAAAKGGAVTDDTAFTGQEIFAAKLKTTLGDADYAAHEAAIFRNAYIFKVSAWWLILAYGIVTLGELMLSPMGLSLVSKVAPIRLRGVMMGGWFVATAIGNKLTFIGVYWEIWRQSVFFGILGAMALFMAVVLFLLLKPLKKAMPGV